MLALLAFVLFAAVCTADDPNKYFTSPIQGTVWAAGSNQVVTWTTNYQSAYTYYLWQQWPQGGGANNVAPIYQAAANTVGTNSFPWTVSYYGANLTYSNIFFIWTASGDPGPNEWSSPYFRMSPQQVVNGLTVTSSSTRTSSTATSTATTTTSSVQSTTLSTITSSASTGSSTSTTGTLASTTSASSAATTSAAVTSGTAIGVGVGVGVGAAVLILALVAGFIVMRRRKRAAVGGAGGSAGTPGVAHDSYYQPMSQNHPAAPPYDAAIGNTGNYRDRKPEQIQSEQQVFEAPSGERAHVELP